jgi:magnesium chelatase family protein
MQIRSYTHSGPNKNNNLQSELIEIIVELALLPGLPGVQFLGLPDQILRESGLRIKSAIKAQGFQFPTHQQVVVNLRPNHMKKTSRGIELAVAVGILWLTGQIPNWVFGEELVIYGELGLDGRVYAPEDLSCALGAQVVLTGARSVSPEGGFAFSTLRLESLSQLRNSSEILRIPGSPKLSFRRRPKEFVDFSFPKEMAHFLLVAALGKHSALLAGPAGSGKTTLGRVVHSLLSEPKSQDLAEDQSWWPLVEPHHTTPVMSMIGGGGCPTRGEIAKAHLGVLLLDEFLEFPSKVTESLRTVMESRELLVSRGGRTERFPADAQIIATTNLCPCGDWTPKEKLRLSCRFNLSKCRSYSQKLSGPILDRFQIIFFTQKIPTGGNIEATEFLTFAQLLARLEPARKRYAQSFELFSDESIEAKFKASGWYPEGVNSHRRRLALVKVARSVFAAFPDSSKSAVDSQGVSSWSITHFQMTRQLAQEPHQQLTRWDL